MNAVLGSITLPWLASSRTSRWLAVAVVAVVLGVVTPAARLYHGPGWVTASAALCIFAIGVLWVLVIPNALWLARDARRLRLPTIARRAHAVPLVYTALTVVLPACLLGFAGGSTLTLLALFALAAAGCLCYLLLPASLALLLLIAFCFAPHLLASVFTRILPQATLSWALPSAVLLGALAAWRWMRLARAGSLGAGVWGVPIALQIRRIREQGYFDTLMSTRNRRVDNLWTWLRPQPALRGLGPDDPVRAIRVALGRQLMPQAWWATALRLVALLAVLAALLWPRFGGGMPEALIVLWASATSAAFIGGVCGGVGATVLMTYMGQIQNRWSGTHAELPLLALLPGLGAASQLRQRTLAACLYKPCACVLMVMLFLLGLSLLRLAAIPLAAAGCTALVGCMALACAMATGTLGGKPLPIWLVLCASAVLLIMFIATLGIADAPSSHAANILLAICAAIWLALLAAFAVLAWRGWCALRQRPHPFLANP